MARQSQQVFEASAPKSVLGRLWGRKLPAEPSAGSSARGSANASPDASEGSSGYQPDGSGLESSATSSARGSARRSRGHGPLTIVRHGHLAKVRNGEDGFDWTPQDFARLFLEWVASEYPSCRGSSIVKPDVEKYFLPRFKAATGCTHLKLGSLLLGLGDVTHKSERMYTDGTGRRRSVMVYDVPLHCQIGSHSVMREWMARQFCKMGLCTLRTTFVWTAR